MSEYIYESPDGGKTIYRRAPMTSHEERQLVGNTSHIPKKPNQKTALVLGGGGFIGSHLVQKLKYDGYWVRAVDLKYPEFWRTAADDFHIGDLRDVNTVEKFVEPWFDEVYQLAADMGGAGFVFTGENDFSIMHNSSVINLNVIEKMIRNKNEFPNMKQKVFYSSSACMYPAYNQEDPNNPKCSEDSAYPAAPDSEYGWEKLFSEHLYMAAKRNFGIDICIARFHNIFGPYGTWEGGREKAPAAVCRKIASLLYKNEGGIEIWGDGEQTRSFLYIDECVRGIQNLMASDKFFGPVNIGSEEMVTINQLVEMVSKIAGKKITIKHIEGPLGVRGRNSDNKLIREKLEWEPDYPLYDGLDKTYAWIKQQVLQKLTKE